MPCRMNRYARAACLALVLACRPSVVAATDGLSQDAAPQVVITPAGVTDELVLRWCCAMARVRTAASNASTAASSRS